jgi:RNA polymerase sigma factor (sigma-70 family)
MPMPALDNERFRKMLLIDPREAIKNLHLNYYDYLLRLSTHFTKDRDASQDILQETFQQIWETREALSQGHESHIEFYLIRVVKIKSMHYYTDQIKERESRENYMRRVNATVARSNFEETLLQRESHVRLREIIKTFPRREKQCLLLSLDEDLNPEEIAQRLDMNRKAVYRSLESGYKRLRTIVSRDSV